MYWFGVPWRLAYQRHEHSPVKRIPIAIDLAMNMRAHLVQLRTNIHQAFPSYYLWAPLPPLSAKHHLLTINAWSAKYHLLRFRKVCLCHSFIQVWRKVLPLFFRNVRNETLLKSYSMHGNFSCFLGSLKFYRMYGSFLKNRCKIASNIMKWYCNIVVKLTQKLWSGIPISLKIFRMYGSFCTYFGWGIW